MVRFRVVDRVFMHSKQYVVPELVKDPLSFSRKFCNEIDWKKLQNLNSARIGWIQLLRGLEGCGRVGEVENIVGKGRVSQRITN